MSEVEVVDREARRAELASRVAKIPELEEQLREMILGAKQRQEQEQERRRAWDLETVRLHAERAKTTARLQAALGARDALRREFVPFHVRQGVGAAGRVAREALARLEDARADARGFARQVSELEDRIREVPSFAASGDLRQEVERVKATLAQAEARVASAQEDYDAAVKVEALARAELDAAMGAAQAS